MSSPKMLMLDLFRISGDALGAVRRATADIVSIATALILRLSFLSYIQHLNPPLGPEVIPFFPSSPFPLDAPALKLKD